MKRSEKKKVVSKRVSQEKSRKTKPEPEVPLSSESKKSDSETESDEWDSDWFEYLNTDFPEENQADVQVSDGLESSPEEERYDPDESDSPREELIKFSMLHGGKKHIDVIDSIIACALSPRSDGSEGPSSEDAEDISNLYLEFVDYCGTIHDVRRALNRHIRLFSGSARKDLHQQSTKSRRPLNLIKDKREEVSVAMPNQAPRDRSSNLENHIVRSNDTDTACLQIVESDDKAEDNARELPLSESEEPRDSDPERNLSPSNLVGVKEESTKVNNLKKDCSESDVSSDNLLHQTASGNQPSQTAQASSNENYVFPQGKCELEAEELKQLSEKSAPLNIRESTCPDSGLVASQVECETIQESRKSNSREVVGSYTRNRYNSSRSTQDSDYAQVHVERNRSYSSSHRDHRTKRPLLPPRYSKNSGGKWGPMKNDGKFRGGPKYGNRGGPKYGNCGNTHRREHQHQHLSPQKIHPADGGAQFPITPGCSQSALQVQQCNQRQDQFQVTTTTADFVAPQSWPIQNIPIQNSLSQSQLPASTTSNVSQYPNAMQGNEQYGYMQNGQDYNQMWQNYYYQQQLQLQQNYIQLQQQPFQPELSQQHSQPEPLQPQQLQPLQLQQQEQYFQQHYIQLQPQSFQPELSQQFQQHSQPEPLQLQQLQQLQLQQVLSQQQEQPGYLQQVQPPTQSRSNSVEDQAQAIVTQQGQEAISSQQSGDPGLISSPALHHLQEKPTQEE